MRRCIPLSRALPPLLTVVMLVAAAADLAAQGTPLRNFHSGMRTGVGYTAVFPDVVAGIGAWQMVGSSRYGVFADAKMTLPSLRSEDFHCPTGVTTCTVDWVETNRNDVFIRDKDEYMIFNAGATYAITPQFMFMLGAGAARMRSVREYFDENDPPITPTGQFFVDHELEPSWEIQAVAGMMLRAGGNLAFRFGYETAPSGMSVGGYIVLP